MSDSPADPHLDEHDTLPPSMDPAVADETVEPPRDFFGILKRLGPGLIIAGSIVGSGELIATTKTGAQAGILLLWLIIIGCLIKVFVQIELGRYTIGHGETTLAALDQVPGPRLRVNWIVWFWLLMMLLGIGQLGGIVGGVGQAAALAVPITGDYEEATQYPSQKEIETYLKWDSVILSEWDVLILCRLSNPTSAKQNLIDLAEFKGLDESSSDDISSAMFWRMLASSAAQVHLRLIERFDPKLASELISAGKRVNRRAGEHEAFTEQSEKAKKGEQDARDELNSLLERANDLLLKNAKSGETTRLAKQSDDYRIGKTFGKLFPPEMIETDPALLLKLSESRRKRVLRGHAILSKRLRELHDKHLLRIYRTVGAVYELNSRKHSLQKLKSKDNDELGVKIAEARIEEQTKVINTILNPPTYDDKIWAAIVTIITALLLVRGRYQMIQNISTILVVGFTFITIGNVIALQMTPEWQISFSQFIDGLSFKLPEATDGVTPLATALATFGIIGVGASELIAYPYWCLEKGYAKFTGKRTDDENWARRARGWMKVMHYDAFASMIVYTLATIAFFVMGVAVLYNEGRDPDGMRMVSTLATAYVPVFGEYARWLFLIGAVAVLYSTFLVATAGNARMYTDAVKIYGLMDHNNQKHHDRALSIFSVILPFMCLAVFCSGANPVRMILLSGAMQALLLPMIGFGALYFRYTRTDGRIKPGPVWDTLLIVSFIGLFIAGSYGAYKQILKFF